MQKAVKVRLGGTSENQLDTLNQILMEGWKVVNMQSYSQHVVTNTENRFDSHSEGDYGMIFVLERE